MYKAVKDVLASNQSVWTGIPAFVTVHGSFINKLTALETSAFNQNLSMIGVSAAKNAKRQEVVDKTYAISSGIVAFAVLNNNAKLIDRMTITKSDMLYASKTRLLLLVDRVIAKASEFESQIDEFGVDQQSITELQTLRDELEAMLNAPRNAILDRKGYTQQIKALRKELDMILYLQLDKLMQVLSAEHPDLFTAYNNARVIVDLKNGSGSSGSGTTEEGSSNTTGYEG